ncbi:MAG: hypothetical protein VZQ96_09970, partial [Succiniclasticum sp.]|nr:hypothetical protein [Succiniclasticum sp.]
IPVGGEPVEFIAEHIRDDGNGTRTVYFMAKKVNWWADMSGLGGALSLIEHQIPVEITDRMIPICHTDRNGYRSERKLAVPSYGNVSDRDIDAVQEAAPEEGLFIGLDTPEARRRESADGEKTGHYWLDTRAYVPRTAITPPEYLTAHSGYDVWMTVRAGGFVSPARAQEGLGVVPVFCIRTENRKNTDAKIQYCRPKMEMLRPDEARGGSVMVNPLRIPPGIEEGTWTVIVTRLLGRAMGLLPDGLNILECFIEAEYRDAKAGGTRAAADWSKDACINSLYHMILRTTSGCSPRDEAMRCRLAKTAEYLSCFAGIRAEEETREHRVMCTGNGKGVDELTEEDLAAIVSGGGLKAGAVRFLTDLFFFFKRHRLEMRLKDINKGELIWSIKDETGYPDDREETFAQMSGRFIGSGWRRPNCCRSADEIFTMMMRAGGVW